MLVDRIWFDNHQWRKFIDDSTHLGYELSKGKFGEHDFKLARWDYISPKENDDEGFYQFFASGNNFKVECKISNESYEEEVILNALKIVGMTDPGLKIDFEALRNMIKFYNPDAKTNLEIYESLVYNEDFYIRSLGIILPDNESEKHSYITDVYVKFGKWLGVV